MSKPDIVPNVTVSGIAVDPRTLDRVIPQSRRPDGTVRKEIKIRPGFTPQEDVSRFRGTRQKQLDSNALPKGHIIGWAPPPKAAPPNPTTSMSKSAKKNAKRKEKREAQRVDVDAKVKDNWEDEDEEGEGGETPKSADAKVLANQPETQGAKTKDDQDTKETDALAKKLEELDVR